MESLHSLLRTHWDHEPWRSGVSAERVATTKPAALCRDAATRRRFMESPLSFFARSGTMNRCASQRRGPDRGSATRSLLGSWEGKGVSATDPQDWFPLCGLACGVPA